MAVAAVVCFVCSYFLLVSLTLCEWFSVRFGSVLSVLFDSILFVPHTVRGILSHYSVFNRTFNLFRCRSNSLLYSNLIFTSYLADLVQ